MNDGAWEAEEREAENRVRQHEERARERLTRWHVIYCDRMFQDLKKLSDASLQDLLDRIATASDDAAEDVQTVITGLLLFMGNETNRRNDLAENARVQLEANGHEVGLSYDEVAADQGVPAWYAYCSCPDGAGEATSYRGAVRVGGEHAAEHDGRWAENEPRPEADYLLR